MASNLVAPISPDNIKLSYINSENVLIEDVSISDANSYAQRNPNTIFIFLDGDNKYRYLNIDEVNKLTPKDLISTSSICDTAPKPCGPPRIIFSGGGGIGAQANPVIGPDSKLVAIDIINPGVGYQTAPKVSVIDNCDTGSGAVVEAIIDDNGRVNSGIIIDPGSGYIPIQSQAPTYPALLGLKEIIVSNPGINYNPGVDVIEITPNNGTILQGIFNSFGQVVSVKVLRPGLGFTSRPTITIRSESGINADLTPVFEVIRDPQIFENRVSQSKIITIIDDVGLSVNGYVNGKPYYGNVYYEGGVKYAGPFKTLEEQKIIVYDTLSESVLNSK